MSAASAHLVNPSKVLPVLSKFLAALEKAFLPRGREQAGESLLMLTRH